MRKLNRLQTNRGTNTLWTGPDESFGPLPAFFYFATSDADSLTLDPFCQIVDCLLEAPFRVFSLMLPFHEAGYDHQKAPELWSEAMGKNDPVFEHFFADCLQAVDQAIELKLADPERIATGGISRGGLPALHLAASHERVNTCLLFAPVTDPFYLEAFKKVQGHPLVKKIAPVSLIPKLAHIRARIYSGNRDVKVGTDRTFAFFQQLVEASFEAGHRSPPIELILSPSIGHGGHGTSKKSFYDGGQWLKELFNS